MHDSPYGGCSKFHWLYIWPSSQQWKNKQNQRKKIIKNTTQISFVENTMHFPLSIRFNLPLSAIYQPTWCKTCVIFGRSKVSKVVSRFGIVPHAFARKRCNHFRNFLAIEIECSGVGWCVISVRHRRFIYLTVKKKNLEYFLAAFYTH